MKMHNESPRNIPGALLSDKADCGVWYRLAFRRLEQEWDNYDVGFRSGQFDIHILSFRTFSPQSSR